MEKGNRLVKLFYTKQIQTSRKELTQTNKQTKECEKFHTTRATLLQLAQWKSCRIFYSFDIFLYFQIVFFYFPYKTSCLLQRYAVTKEILLSIKIYIYTLYTTLVDKVVLPAKFASVEGGLVKLYTHKENLPGETKCNEKVC